MKFVDELFDKYTLIRDEIKIDMSRVWDESSPYHRGSEVVLTNILTGEFVREFGDSGTSQLGLLERGLIEYKRVVK